MAAYCLNNEITDTDLKSSLNICPINVTKLEQVIKQVKHIDAALFLAKIKFHQKQSQIQKNNKVWIARTRQQLSEWFGFSNYKVDTLLKHLTKLGLIETKVGLWYGQKRIFIAVSANVEELPMNTVKLHQLNSRLNSLLSTVVFSKIAFCFANTKIQHEEKNWCSITKQALAQWANVSIRTIDKTLEELIKKGLILKKKFSWNNKTQSHFHIPTHLFSELTKEPKKKVINKKNCRLQPAKLQTSIIKNINKKKTNNNITTKTKRSVTKQTTKTSDISFDLLSSKLTDRQSIYLKQALVKTIDRKKLKISSPIEILAQITFYLTNPEQRKGIISFRHAVSRALKILTDGNWRTPKGFNNYSSSGVALKKKKQQEEQTWQNLKKQYQAVGFKQPNINADCEILTQQAKTIADKIMEQATTNPSNQILDYLTQELNKLLQRGANKSVLKKYFYNKKYIASLTG